MTAAHDPGPAAARDPSRAAQPPRDPLAFERLYSQLLELARARWRREPISHTLQATAVANEVFLRLRDFDPAALPDELAVRRYLAGAVRNFLFEYARRREAEQRGGGWTRTDLDDVIEVVEHRVGSNASELDEVLEALGESHPEAAEVVHLRFFAGLTFEQIGQAMGRTSRQVERLWLDGREWLRQRLEAGRRPR